MAHDMTNGKITQYKKILLCVDGGAQPKNPGVAACGWVIMDVFGKTLVEESRIVSLDNTNNYAEYCGLGFSLRWLRDQNWRGGHLTIQADSQLLIYQVDGLWRCKAKNLLPLKDRVMEHLDAMGLSKANGNVLFNWVPREKNSFADALSDAAFAQHWNPKDPPPPNFAGL